MARKYIQMGKTTAENVTAINDNFSELYEARTSIYDDVEQLQTDVAQLQSDMSTAQQDIRVLQNMSGRTPLSANTDLNTLGAGHYYIPNYDISVTITNKPDATGQTATIDVVEAGSTGQLIMIYRGCIKEYINEWVRVYYADSWGDWLKEGGNDSGWINLTLNTGWSMDDYASEVPQYRKIGNIVYLRGLVNATTAAGNILATLPQGFRPSGYFNRFVCSLNQSDNAVVQINANGQINDHQKGSKSRMFLSLNGISFVADY
jgi:hypothetical protein